MGSDLVEQSHDIVVLDDKLVVQRSYDIYHSP